MLASPFEGDEIRTGKYGKRGEVPVGGADATPVGWRNPRFGADATPRTLGADATPLWLSCARPAGCVCAACVTRQVDLAIDTSTPRRDP